MSTNTVGIFRTSNRVTDVLMIALLIPVLLIVGLALGYGAWIPSIGIFGILIVGFFYAILAQTQTGQMRNDLFFWVLVAILFIGSLFNQLTGISILPLMELTLFFLLPMIIYNYLPLLLRSGRLQLLVALLGVYMIIAMLSTYFGRSHFLPAVYQMLTNFKPLMLMSLGMTLVWSERTERWFWLLVKWLWVPLMVTVLIQIVAPSLYQHLLIHSGSLGNKPNPFIPSIMREFGLFHHSAVLASIGALFSIFCFLRHKVTKQSSWMIAAVFYFLLIIASGQRQELVAYLMTAIALHILWKWPGSVYKLAFSSMLFFGMVILLIWPWVGDSIVRHISDMFSNNYYDYDTDNVRNVLYSDSFYIADKWWPLGSGLGTFASAGAVKFDPSLFYDLGYTRYWWFLKESFLTDAFWAMYIAEVGWVGTFFLLLSFLLILQRAISWFVNATDPRLRLYTGMGLFAFSFSLLTSPTSYMLIEPIFGLFGSVFLGIAYRMVLDHRKQIRSHSLSGA